MKRYQKAVIVALGIFFVFAIIMTCYSQDRYEQRLCDVAVSRGREGTLMLRKTKYVEREPHDYNDIAVTWDLGIYNDQLYEGKEVTVCTDEDVLKGVIVKKEIKEGGIPFILVKVDWTLTPSEEYWDVILEVMVESIEYEHIFPVSCLWNNGGDCQIPVVYSRQKRWGTERYVHFEDTYVYERNETECALRDVPYEGEVIYKSAEMLFENKNVRVVNQ